MKGKRNPLTVIFLQSLGVEATTEAGAKLKTPKACTPEACTPKACTAGVADGFGHAADTP
jgi:hypothetical protein